jgi:hypothetical protein
VVHLSRNLANWKASLYNPSQYAPNNIPSHGYTDGASQVNGDKLAFSGYVPIPGAQGSTYLQAQPAPYHPEPTSYANNAYPTPQQTVLSNQYNHYPPGQTPNVPPSNQSFIQQPYDPQPQQGYGSNPQIPQQVIPPVVQAPPGQNHGVFTGVGALGGASVGYMVANVPGAFAGAAIGGKLGYDRSVYGTPAYERMDSEQRKMLTNAVTGFFGFPQYG